MLPLKFVHRRVEADDIVSFFFEPSEPLIWQAGQSLKLEVPTVYGPSEHRFSIASAPSEKHVIITTRLSGSIYKTGLDNLQPGDEVRGGAVEGDFIWQTKEPVILVAAGIGITPYRSILLQRKSEQLPLNATLIIGARGHQPIYNREFGELAQQHPELRVAHELDRRLDASFVLQHTQNIASNTIYVSGPSAMVDELSEQLVRHGADQAKIRRDWFTGRIDY